MAAVNVLTGLLQVAAWRRAAWHVHLTLRNLDRTVLKEMFSYCSVLSIWSVGMLFVTGLDVTIVGHYDYGQTAFYSVATLPTNFIISIIGSAFAPLLPSASALSATRSPVAMGQLLSRLTRYSTLLFGIAGLPVMVAGHWLLSHWVGNNYAVSSVGYLRILLLANLIRNVGMPYATFLAATGNQRVAIGGAIAEAVVNLGVSIFLVQRIGAIGVAYGTLIGAVVSVGVHFLYNMRFTYPMFSIKPFQLLLEGVMRPLVLTVPALLLVRSWWSNGALSLGPVPFVGLAIATLVLVWFVTITADERAGILNNAASRFGHKHLIN